MTRDWITLHERRKAKPCICYWDEELGVTVHRFAPGKYICRCGQKIVRQPVRKQRAGYYGKGGTWPAKKKPEEEKEPSDDPAS